MHSIKLYIFVCFLLCTMAIWSQSESIDISEFQEKLPMIRDDENADYSSVIRDIRKAVIDKEPDLLDKGDFRELEMIVINIATEKLKIPFNQKDFITNKYGLYRDCAMHQAKDIEKYYMNILSAEQRRSLRQYEQMSKKKNLLKSRPIRDDYKNVIYDDMIERLMNDEESEEHDLNDEENGSSHRCKKVRFN